MSKVVVVGSVNMDIVNRVHNFPAAGETIKGLSIDYIPGGKGGNQAIAASLAGGKATMIGAVGQDAYATQILKVLKSYGVNTRSFLTKEGFTGMAFIAVNDQGENTIILSEGANGKIDFSDIQTLIPILSEADVLLLQNEIPWNINELVIEVAHQLGITVILNPAPARRISDEVMKKIDVIILNETEIESITGIQVHDPLQADQALQLLLSKGVKTAILTLGDKGCMYIDSLNNRLTVPAFTVTPVDTTAAGDTFIGAFAAVYKTNISIEEKLTFASAAAAIAVTREGAAYSIPNREEIDQFLEKVSIIMEKR